MTLQRTMRPSIARDQLH